MAQSDLREHAVCEGDRQGPVADDARDPPSRAAPNVSRDEHPRGTQRGGTTVTAPQ